MLYVNIDGFTYLVLGTMLEFPLAVHLHILQLLTQKVCQFGPFFNILAK